MGGKRAAVCLGVAAATLAGGLGGMPAAAYAAAPVTAGPVTVARVVTAGCATGKYQKQVEGYLKKLGGYGSVTVDGRQSGADCAAITKFQKRFGIQPAAGEAGPTTYDVAQRLAATKPAACNAKKSGLTFCVDLTHQTTWVMKNGKVLGSPTITRTGKKGYRTPAGTFSINKRTKKEWSDPYHVWLPYWQRFIGGRGFHQTTTYIHDKSRGSHGCVNLSVADAKWVYENFMVGDVVEVNHSPKSLPVWDGLGDWNVAYDKYGH